MKPVLPIICTRYEIRNPVFHLPNIRHSFAEQSIGYCLIKQLNAEEGSTLTTNMVHTDNDNDNDNTFIEHKYRLQMKIYIYNTI